MEYAILIYETRARAGGVAAAEDALGDAFVRALTTWRRDGVPEKQEA